MTHTNPGPPPAAAGPLGALEVLGVLDFGVEAAGAGAGAGFGVEVAGAGVGVGAGVAAAAGFTAGFELLAEVPASAYQV